MSTAYKGRFALGDRVPLTVQCRNNNGTASEPASAPLAMIYSDSGFVASQLMPIVDRYGIVGFFEYELLLDGRFSAGQHTVIYHYTISGTPFAAQQDFTVAAGGQIDGQILGMYYYAKSGADYLLQPTDGGRLIRKRNPRV